MRLDEKEIELIDSYLENKLSLLEKREVERKIRLEPEFAAEVYKYKQFFRRVKTISSGSELLSPAFQRKGTPQNSSWTFKPQKLTGSLAIVLFAFACLIAIPAYLLHKHSANTEQVFSQFYPQQPVPVLKGEAAFMPVSNGEAHEHFSQGRYEQAALLFEADLELKPQDPEALFYAGLSQLSLGHAPEAIVLLQKVVLLDNPYKTDAQWYLALAHLRHGTGQLARNILQEIIASKSPYKAEAAQALRHL